jgi:putative membrane protein
VILVFAFLTLGYLRGWLRLRSMSSPPDDAWRAISFLFGVFLVWVALDSPLADYDHHLLTVHMIQHLLLMTVAPPLILLGEPLAGFWHGLPRFGHVVIGRWLQPPSVQRVALILSKPALCWTVSTLTLVVWHVPAVFTIALESEVWHLVEQSSFLGAGFLFWWPVVQPWPSVSTGPQWSTLLYLFLATLPCDIPRRFSCVL